MYDTAIILSNNRQSDGSLGGELEAIEERLFERHPLYSSSNT